MSDLIEITAERHAALARAEAAEADVAQLREVLRFYAEGEWAEDYPGGVLYDPEGHLEKNHLDYGDKARAALTAKGDA